MNYFELFELKPHWDIDKSVLRSRYYALSRDYHDDIQAIQDDTLSDLGSPTHAEINEAYEVLSDENKRLDYLVHLLGWLSDDSSEQLDPEFLMEIMEINEALEEENANATQLIDDLQNRITLPVKTLLHQKDWQEFTEAEQDIMKDFFLKNKYLMRIK